MKKILFTVITSLLCCAFANAQFGITGGGNLSKYKYTSDREPIFGWNAGIFYSTTAKKGGLVVQPALTYTVKGAVKYTDPYTSTEIERYFNHLNYAELSMPFILRVPIDGSDIFKVDLGVGPYVGYLVKATYTSETYDGVKVTNNYKIGTSGTDDFKPLDAGLSFVMGMRLANIGMNLQYDLGLANTNTIHNDAPLKMRALMFNFLIYFGK